MNNRKTLDYSGWRILSNVSDPLEIFLMFTLGTPIPLAFAGSMATRTLVSAIPVI
ncbi:MAG TPA: hypothetical protein VGG14_15660 [Candidatus Sulfotelmatobacter sp.]|jgi:hypothetical protein